MAIGSSSPTDGVILTCPKVAFVHLLEGIGGDHFAIEFTLATGDIVRLGFASERAEELIEAIRRSQQECAARRAVVRH